MEIRERANNISKTQFPLNTQPNIWGKIHFKKYYGILENKKKLFFREGKHKYLEKIRNQDGRNTEWQMGMMLLKFEKVFSNLGIHIKTKPTIKLRGE